MNRATKIGGYRFRQGEPLMLDANVWLSLFPAPSNSNRHSMAVYSSAFKAMLQAKANIYISSTILSEYLNRYTRIEWMAVHQPNYPNYKNFRCSKDFPAVGQQAASFARNILKTSIRVDDDFAVAPIGDILHNFEHGRNDFNDGVIAASCKKNGWSLVTHDGDFTMGDINILTDNNRLISVCSAP